jgi:hypothetical protein
MMQAEFHTAYEMAMEVITSKASLQTGRTTVYEYNNSPRAFGGPKLTKNIDSTLMTTCCSSNSKEAFAVVFAERVLKANTLSGAFAVVFCGLGLEGSRP